MVADFPIDALHTHFCILDFIGRCTGKVMNNLPTFLLGVVKLRNQSLMPLNNHTCEEADFNIRD